MYRQAIDYSTVGWTPSIVLFSLRERFMKQCHEDAYCRAEGEVFTFLVGTPDVYVMCLSLQQNMKYLCKAPRSVHG